LRFGMVRKRKAALFLLREHGKWNWALVFPKLLARSAIRKLWDAVEA
jgi:hypothetical protein